MPVTHGYRLRVSLTRVSAGQDNRNVVVRGGVEPPTFRFSGGFGSSGKSTAVRLTRSYGTATACVVQDQPHASRIAVSGRLARSQGRQDACDVCSRQRSAIAYWPVDDI
jgi:hypothetical protein